MTDIPKRTIRLFDAERDLRAAARSYAGWSAAPRDGVQRQNLEVLRKDLRRAAIAFTRIADEIDGASK